MQIFLIVVHVISCLFLIAVILLQAGRGGGLSDIAGGSQAQSILGTETNTFMKRLTEIFAVVFIVTSLSLGIISTHRGKSLIEQRRQALNFKKNLPFAAEVQKAAKDAAVTAKETTATSTAKTAESAIPAPGSAAAPVSTTASSTASAAVAAPSPAPAGGNAK